MYAYSVDMLRLETKVNVVEFQKWFNNALVVSPVEYTYTQSFKHSDYRHLWSIKNTGVFNNVYGYAIMFAHNMEKPSFTRKLVIEFNPNKVWLNDSFLSLILPKYFMNCTIKSLDMAVDIDININSVNYLNTGKEQVINYKDATGQGVYFGKRGTGQVKMYDKAKELGLTDGTERTRIEKTMKIDMPIGKAYYFNFSSETWPDLYIPQGYERFDSDLDVVDRLVLLGLRQRPDLAAQLSKYQRKKYSSMLKTDKIAFEPEKMRKALKTTLDDIAAMTFGCKDRLWTP